MMLTHYMQNSKATYKMKASFSFLVLLSNTVIATYFVLVCATEQGCYSEVTTLDGAVRLQTESRPLPTICSCCIHCLHPLWSAFKGTYHCSSFDLLEGFHLKFHHEKHTVSHFIRHTGEI